MTFRKGLFLGVLVVLLSAGPSRAEMLQTEVIDTPTADSVDVYGYETSFRFYSGGGVLSKAVFGVFPRLNVGFGLDVQRLIGASPSVNVNTPTLNVRFRFFDGKRSLPALALGYDGQGYLFDEEADEYAQKEKGLYLVGTGEIVFPGLFLNGGVNIEDFSSDSVFAFAGLRYVLQDMVAFQFEADNLRIPRDSRLNAGIRLFLSPSFSIDLAARDLFAALREEERVVRLIYFGSF